MSGLDQIDKVVDVDQSPIGRSPRSNPATYSGAFTGIRNLFAQVPEARVRGWESGRFSFNVKGGRCEACEGDGAIRMEMQFLPDAFVGCEVCGGRRYDRETLSIRHRGKSIADVLEMTVLEALALFENIPTIARPLQALSDVGLDYLRLGQSATTLSGGEAQRMKLAKELARKATGRTLYLLDEPTTGLHFVDVEQLLGLIDRLVDRGNTVVVIEHNLDVIRYADHIVDLGPEGGDAGGEIVVVGTPEEVARSAESHTGVALALAMESHRTRSKQQANARQIGLDS
jgi:excinuclease ABC subunit A